jgi:hypothetical protein
MASSLITSLSFSLCKQELYPNDDYAKINWYSIRSYVSPLDLYYPHSTLLECLYGTASTVITTITWSVDEAHTTLIPPPTTAMQSFWTTTKRCTAHG